MMLLDARVQAALPNLLDIAVSFNGKHRTKVTLTEKPFACGSGTCYQGIAQIIQGETVTVTFTEGSNGNMGRAVVVLTKSAEEGSDIEVRGEAPFVNIVGWQETSLAIQPPNIQFCFEPKISRQPIDVELFFIMGPYKARE
ncbi:MAG: hypothetical protein A2Y57_02305 [Candidatus Woykebacteria bacterium RBG_13_40_7b]|uniref:Uncharacterized protein n=1 Tax=Candidatus Woykebacteria bacterium RBG_13_40_7b TaxID=1802594 RepID=A0A1G1WB81_9BACT|nr:MAG: hypothetical protein A2Y57_02305 [Candidatus Woykebacteria bacterium RBG_13_40_7b]